MKRSDSFPGTRCPGKTRNPLLSYLPVFLFLVMAGTGLGQVNFLLEGPYTDYAGPYRIKVAVHFVPDNSWSQSELDQATLDILGALNAEFNQYEIYFSNAFPDGMGNHCGTGHGTVQALPFNTIGTVIQDEHAIDIFVGFKDPASGDPTGDAGAIPNTQFLIQGDPVEDLNGFVGVLVHEMGHCLGLYHVFTDTSLTCDESTGSCSVSGSSDICDCCGDHVCDTPEILPTSGFTIEFEVEPDCSASIGPPGLPASLFRNYMCYTDQSACRDRFTAGQVKRMWAMLALSGTMQELLGQTVNQTTTFTTGVFGNIVVKDGAELIIDGPVEMMPGTHILVETGGLLTVNSTITGACGELWQGVKVEGNAFLAQNTADQGKVVVKSSGKIEHARVGIDVQAVDGNGVHVTGSGGGIIEVYTGRFENNEIGIRFGPYTDAPNASKNIFPRFVINDNYRSDGQPTFVELNGTAMQFYSGPIFHDQRTACDKLFGYWARGMVLNNAGARVLGGTFKNLEVGIYANMLNEGTGSFLVRGSDFRDCARGILSNETSSFTIGYDNSFYVRRPSSCTDPESLIVGVEIRGETTGFRLFRNSFSYGRLTFPEDVLVGTMANGLGEGLANTIRDNGYTDMFIGNRALGANSGINDGLLYLCNTHTLDKVTYPYPDVGKNYLVEPGSTVKDQQGLETNQNIVLPTGNIFSELEYSFYNNGANPNVDYHYLDGDDDQDPTSSGNSLGGLGINAIDVDIPNGNCYEEQFPDFPGTYDFDIDTAKDEFYAHKSDWLAKKTALASITDTTELELAKDTIRFLRERMNWYASLIVHEYAQDTLGVMVDSVLLWLGHVESYPADLRIARHYLFTGDTASFDALWTQLPVQHGLAGDELAVYQEVDLVYSLIRPHIVAGRPLEGLPVTVLDSLDFWSEWCSAPGFLVQGLLAANDIWAEPDCSAGVDMRPAVPEKENGRTLGTEPSSVWVYPNPARDRVIIRMLKGAGQGELLLVDMQGRHVMRRELTGLDNRSVVELDSVPGGVYFLTLKDYRSGLIHQERIVIAR